MTWTLVLLACTACFALKLAGHLLPADRLAGDLWARVPALVTVALLAALVAVQTLADGTALRPDARIVAVAVAALALWRRLPFVVVVVLAAATAAGLRAVGW